MSQSNRTPWIAAVGGGIVGAALTAGTLFLAVPSLLGDRMVRDALIANPEMLIDAGNARRLIGTGACGLAGVAAIQAAFA